MSSSRARPWTRPSRGVLTLLLGSLVVLALVFGLFAHRVHELRQRRAVGPGWAFPTRVYASDVPLAAGAETPEPFLWGTAPSLVCQHALMGEFELASLEAWERDSVQAASVDSLFRDDPWSDEDGAAEPDSLGEREPPPDDPSDAWPPAEPDTTIEPGGTAPFDASTMSSSPRDGAPPAPQAPFGSITDSETVTLLRWQQLWTRRSWSLA